jgi:hypothetical protein
MTPTPTPTNTTMTPTPTNTTMTPTPTNTTMTNSYSYTKSDDPETNTVSVTGNLLVHYSTTRTGLSVTHKRITNENCGRTGASPKALRTVAKVFESKGTPIGQIQSLFQQTHGDIANLGMRISTGGHLVRADKLEQVNGIFDTAGDQLERLRGQLRRDYPELVAQSKKQLGTAADDIVFPSAEEVAAKFTQRLDFAPDPLSGSVLLDGVSSEVASKVRSQINDSRTGVMRDAQRNLIKELLEFFTGAGESDPGILGVLGSDCRLRSSRFNRLKKRLDTAKDYNQIGSEEFDEAIALLEPIANADLDEIRGSDDKRRELQVTANKAVDSVTTGTLASLGLTA